MKPKVLIVDDDPATRDMLRLGLEDESYEVFEASSGKQVMELLNAHRPMLVILDILMEEQEGIETLREIRRFYPTMPIIMISTDGFYLTLAERMGANAVLEKPIDLRQLYKLCKELIANV